MSSEFICLDGEGMDTDRDTRTHKWVHIDPFTREKHVDVYQSREHIYTFLASSTGHCIRNWEDGLSTADCFEFILGEKKQKTILIGFSFGYDSCMMYRDIDSELLKVLWETGRTYTYQGDKLYRLDYFPGKWLTISHVDRVGEKTKILRSAKVWDCFGFFQHSFIRSLEEWLPEADQDILNTIARMKEARGNFANESREEIESYCLEECRLLKILMTKLRDTLESTDIYLKSWHGAGAISGYLFAQHFIDRHVHWDDMPELAQEASLWSYFGGRIELFTQGFIDPPFYEHDINSAYPAAIIDLPSLRRGVWYGCIGGEINARNPATRYGMWYCSWNTSNHPLEWLSPFPQRDNTGGIYWSTTGRGWYHTPEVLGALDVFGTRITIERGVYFIPADWSEKPFSWLADLMEKRIEYKNHGDPRHIVLKLGANSGYGKLAQGSSSRNVSGGRPRYQNYYLAGRVTACCRAQMLAAISQFNREDVISAATDGLYTRVVCDGIQNRERVLGAWTIKEKTEPAFFGQAGVVFTPSGKEVKSRGFRKTSIAYADCVRAWGVAGGDWASFGIQYQERRFNGLGYCASTGRWDEFRRWVDRRRDFALRTEPRKGHIESESDDTAWQSYVLSPGTAPAENVAYTPKQPGLAMNEEELLELVDMIEQPEYIG